MEKVWDELKRIEAQAEQVRNEAQRKAKEIVNISEQKSEKLLIDAKTYAEEEAQQLFNSTVKEVSRRQDEQLKANAQATETLRQQAEKRMEQGEKAIVASVLGEQKVG